MTIPMISNIMPIRKAFDSNLRASLDIYHRHAGEMSMVVHKIAMMGLSLPQTIMSLLLIGFGFITYYVIPSAYLYKDMEMFILIFSFILLLNIVGMIFLVQII